MAQADIPDGWVALVQAVLWPAEWLAVLTVGRPNPRKEPRVVRVPVPPDVPLSPPAPTREPAEPTVEALCRTLRWLRNWRYRVSQEYVAHGKPAHLEQQMTALDKKANEVVERLWPLLIQAEPPKRKQRAS